MVLLCLIIFNLFFFFCRSLLVHLENGYFGRGFDQICPQLHHYNTYVDNIYNASKVLAVRKQQYFYVVIITPLCQADSPVARMNISQAVYYIRCD